jgi:hypothetical protein
VDGGPCDAGNSGELARIGKRGDTVDNFAACLSVSPGYRTKLNVLGVCCQKVDGVGFEYATNLNIARSLGRMVRRKRTRSLQAMLGLSRFVSGGGLSTATR